MAVLVAVDLAGGLLAVASGVNTWSEAWGGKALLAAPVPMIAVQVLLTWIAVTRRGRAAAVAAGVLPPWPVWSASSPASSTAVWPTTASTVPLVAFQVFLLLVTGVVGVLALARARALRPSPGLLLTGQESS